MTADNWKSLIIKILLMILTPLAAQLHLSMGPTDLAAIAADFADLAVLAYGIYRSNGMKLVPHTAVAIDPHTPQDAAAPVGANVAGKVVGLLLIAFALSLFLAGAPAFAQAKLTGNLARDIATATGKPSTSTDSAIGNILGALDDKLLPDLQYALKLATASGSKVTAPCYQAWIDIIQTRQKAVTDDAGQPLALPMPRLITDFEKAVELRNALQPESDFMIRCSPVASMVKQDIIGFIGKVMAGGAGLATLVPGL